MESKYRKVLDEFLGSSEADEYLKKIPKTSHEAWLLTTALCSVVALETLDELLAEVRGGKGKLRRKKV